MCLSSCTKGLQLFCFFNLGVERVNMWFLNIGNIKKKRRKKIRKNGVPAVKYL